VGLRRAGLPLEARRVLKHAFRLLYRSDLNTSQAIEAIRNELPREENVEQLVAFIESSKRGTTAGVTVQLGEYDSVEADSVQERLRGGDRVLADHRVDHEQDLVRVDRVPDVGGLLHHLRVDAEPAGGVDDHDVVHLRLGVLDRVPGYRDRITDPAARLRGEHRNAGPLAYHLQLLYRVRSLQVRGDKQRMVALRLEPAS
jgi:hypothetical protein